jgi:hypothetical protein
VQGSTIEQAVQWALSGESGLSADTQAQLKAALALADQDFKGAWAAVCACV